MMGCLLEWLLFPFELIFDLIIGGWLSLMQWIVPEKHIGRSFRIFLKIIVVIISAVLFVIFFIGILAAILTDATVIDLWKFIFIPLGFSFVQIILGIIVRIKTRKK